MGSEVQVDSAERRLEPFE